MDTKLTLKLDKEVIEKAKLYAAKQKVSLSWLFENYLKAITNKNANSDEDEISDFVKSISIGKGKISSDVDYKKEYYDYIDQKYK
ncbi:DUF6364 family protein [Flavobacterium sp.]|uniref:DUF6364 family protein n=1 Tax=Flavobacterium sp. TaxID=239 RepID=UPI002608592A|nr:DUF6364 family protein [Flavobacterium sp.]